jgi:hypothetical protein
MTFSGLIAATRITWLLLLLQRLAQLATHDRRDDL